MKPVRFFVLFLAVFSASVQAASVDLKKPVFSKENAMLCKTESGFLQASNARLRGWRFVPTAGTKTPQGLTTGSPVTPATFDCDLLHDGFELSVLSRTFSYAQTNFGYVGLNELRN